MDGQLNIMFMKKFSIILKRRGYMDRNQALEIVKQQLTDKRYIHTVGVMETAIELANRYGCSEKQAEIAAIFHDYAKFRPKEEMKAIIIEQNFPQDLLQFHHEL